MVRLQANSDLILINASSLLRVDQESTMSNEAGPVFHRSIDNMLANNVNGLLHSIICDKTIIPMAFLVEIQMIRYVHEEMFKI